jgi:hypothetical protein
VLADVAVASTRRLVQRQLAVGDGRYPDRDAPTGGMRVGSLEYLLDVGAGQLPFLVCPWQAASSASHMVSRGSIAVASMLTF